MKEELYWSSDSLAVRLMRVISKSSTYLQRRSCNVFRKYGLTQNQYSVLNSLYNKDSLTINELLIRSLSTGGNMTIVINNLEAAGLVTRRTNPSDSRSTLISITPAGRDIIAQVIPKQYDNVTDAFSMYSDEEKLQLIALLERMMS